MDSPGVITTSASLQEADESNIPVDSEMSVGASHLHGPRASLRHPGEITTK